MRTTEKKCCGIDCDTPFCPICGRKMKRGSAHALLDHVRNTANRERTRATKMRRREPDCEYTVMSEESADKWEQWLALVSAWIARDAQEAKP